MIGPRMRLLPAACAALIAIASSAVPAADAKGQQVEKFLADAEKLIRDHDFSGKSTPHYKLRTDDPRFDVAAAAALLEEFRGWFESFWAGRRELRPRDEPSMVYLFYSRFKYRQLLPDERAPDGIELVGHYQVFYDVIALHTDTVPMPDMPDILVHEAAHQLVQHRLLSPDRPTSLWLGEGLATYFGNTLRDTKGAWSAGQIGGKSAALFREKTARGGEGLARRKLRGLQSELGKDKEGRLGPRAILAMTDPAAFYGPEATTHYALSWILTHYMLHADGGAHLPGFLKYLQSEAAGEGGAEVFYRDTGLDPDRIEADFRGYTKKLTAR